VVAGTATAVSNRVSRRQANRWNSQAQEQAPPEPQYQEPAPVYQAPPPQAPPPSTAEDRIAALTQLAQLKEQGILTDVEFELEKSKILAS
jgi:hypothetical protein